MRRWVLIPGIVVLLTTILPPATLCRPQVSKTLSASETARAFYRYHFSHNKCYDEACLRQRRRWLTAELYNLLMYELHRKLPPDTVGYIEGDPFTSSQETPHSFRIGKSSQHGSRATVEVFVYWLEQGRVADQRKYSFVMVKGSVGWKIADLIDHEGGSLRNGLRELKRKDSQS